MSKKPLPPMEPANVGKQPPFVPITMKTSVGPTPKGVYQEIGPSLMLYDYFYAGLNQTSQINFKYFPPAKPL